MNPSIEYARVNKVDLKDRAPVACPASSGRAVEAPGRCLDERGPGIAPVASAEGVEGGEISRCVDLKDGAHVDCAA